MNGHQSSRICDLASKIASQTSIYNEYLVSNGHPDPSFSIETPPKTDLPSNVAEVRNSILESTEDLQALILGPIGYVQRQTLEHTNLIGLHAVYRYRIAESFPVDSEASYTQIAKTCGLSESQVRRFILYTMTKHIFKESKPGFVIHTAASRALAEESGLRDWVGMICEEMWPAAGRTVDAMAKWAGSEEPEHTGFALVNDTSTTVFAELASHPDRERRFANAMSTISQEDGYEPSHLVSAFDWTSISPCVFVDIGGSHGTISIALTSQNPHIRCIVQDLPKVVEEARTQVPSHLLYSSASGGEEQTIEFMAHDFFKEQPVKGADFYFFRWVFHDWSDKYCVKLLRALIPALKDGARIIVSDFTVPPPGVIPRYSEWLVRAFDLAMLELFNSKEREADEWMALFQAADERFQFVDIKFPPGSKLSFVEVRWNAGLRRSKAEE